MNQSADRSFWVILLALALAPSAPAETQGTVGHSDPITYGKPRQLCELANRQIDESSGLACSRRTPGVFWTHNDSGDLARLFAFNLAGEDLGQCTLVGINAMDWEDMASFTIDGKAYLLIGDLGNNEYATVLHRLYLVEEPRVDPNARHAEWKTRPAQTVFVEFPAHPRNCEAMAFDPTTKTVFLIEKVSEPKCHVFTIAWPKAPSSRPQVAQDIAVLAIPTVTAMDISPDGRRAVVLTYGDAYEYTREAHEDWPKAFARAPRVLAMPKRSQGESIAYGPDGRTLYLTSENLPTPLWEVPAEIGGGRAPARVK
ncbi:MAG: hypothetical protein ACYC35_05545 [Pirellulales bacterium]